MNSSQIAFISPEIVPFAKTGGLADVAGALPAALTKLGHTVKVFMPLYAEIDLEKYQVVSYKINLELEVAGKQLKYDLYHRPAEQTGCEFYFIKLDQYFNRPGLYVSPETGKDWEDNDERFIGFSKAALEAIIALGFKPDIIHCNDWQSALIPAYLKCSDRYKELFAKTKTILTIHNIAYQGLFPKEAYSKIGLDDKWFYPMSAFEFHEQVSFLKAGISYADIITTVSERYAREIQYSSI